MSRFSRRRRRHYSAPAGGVDRSYTRRGDLSYDHWSSFEDDPPEAFELPPPLSSIHRYPPDDVIYPRPLVGSSGLVSVFDHLPVVSISSTLGLPRRASPPPAPRNRMSDQLSGLFFRNPAHVYACVQRHVRREVLHALALTGGRGPHHGPYKRSVMSNWSCR